jgi:hypothetical protein
MRSVIIFDLDATVIDSSHRTPNKPDGTLDLAKYLKLKNHDAIMADTLLPLSRVMREVYEKGHYVIICTSRGMEASDFHFLDVNDLPYHKCLHRAIGQMTPDGELKRRKLNSYLSLKQFRNRPVYMFDDAKPVIAEVRRMGIPCMNADKINRRLLAA